MNNKTKSWLGAWTVVCVLGGCTAAGGGQELPRKSDRVQSVDCVAGSLDIQADSSNNIIDEPTTWDSCDIRIHDDVEVTERGSLLVAAGAEITFIETRGKSASLEASGPMLFLGTEGAGTIKVWGATTRLLLKKANHIFSNVALHLTSNTSRYPRGGDFEKRVNFAPLYVAPGGNLVADRISVDGRYGIVVDAGTASIAKSIFNTDNNAVWVTNAGGLDLRDSVIVKRSEELSNPPDWARPARVDNALFTFGHRATRDVGVMIDLQRDTGFDEAHDAGAVDGRVVAGFSVSGNVIHGWRLAGVWAPAQSVGTIDNNVIDARYFLTRRHFVMHNAGVVLFGNPVEGDENACWVTDSIFETGVLRRTVSLPADGAVFSWSVTEVPDSQPTRRYHPRYGTGGLYWGAGGGGGGVGPAVYGAGARWEVSRYPGSDPLVLNNDIVGYETGVLIYGSDGVWQVRKNRMIVTRRAIDLHGPQPNHDNIIDENAVAQIRTSPLMNLSGVGGTSADFQIGLFVADPRAELYNLSTLCQGDDGAEVATRNTELVESAPGRWDSWGPADLQVPEFDGDGHLINTPSYLRDPRITEAQFRAFLSHNGEEKLFDRDGDFIRAISYTEWGI